MGNKHVKAAPLKFITTLLYSHFFDNFLCSILFQSFCWRKNHEQEPTNDKFTYSTRNVWFTNNEFILKAIHWLISSIFYAILMIEMRMHLLGVFLCCSHLFLYWHFWCAFDRNTFDQIDSLFVFVQIFMVVLDCGWVSVCVCLYGNWFSIFQWYFSESFNHVQALACYTSVCTVCVFARKYCTNVFLLSKRRRRRRRISILLKWCDAVSNVRVLWNPTGNNQIITILMRTKVNVRIAL